MTNQHESKNLIKWQKSRIINNIDNFIDKGPDARNISPGKFGSQYPRLVKLKNGNLLVVYTVYRNNGYIYDKNGGTKLEVSVSCDKGLSWKPITTISEPGRDLDNGQMIQLENGDILLAYRSVIWQQSYTLPVYKSEDNGATWEYLSTIDSNNGKLGELGKPDQGIYEPHFCTLDDNSFSVMYASEKYSKSTPKYSQIIIEKISADNGLTWGEEIWVVCDTKHENARPGMPVWTRMADGRYIVVYEIIATEGGDVFFKTSKNGINWGKDTGKRILNQKGGAYVLSMSNGWLFVTSNTHNLSISDDFGENWFTNKIPPFKTLWNELKENGSTCVIENGNLWPSIYEVDKNTMMFMTSSGRETGGNNIQIRYGKIL